jgi:flagellar assembly protein FliH
MAVTRVIKAGSRRVAAGPLTFNFDDLTDQATRYLSEIKRQGDAILKQAEEQAVERREEAREAGYAEGLNQADEEIEQRARARAERQILPSLEKAVKQLAEGRAAFLRAWETSAIRLAIALAERLVRRTIAADAGVTPELVSEALELAAGSAEITLRMNPDDLRTLGSTVDDLLKNLGQAAPIRTVADERLAQGDCIVQTRDGTIDARLTARLERIEQELLG